MVTDKSDLQPSNDDTPIEVTNVGILMEEREVHDENVSCCSDTSPVGRLTVGPNEVQYLKADAPILVTPTGIFILVRPEHFSNELSKILNKDDGSVIEFSLLQP